MTTEWVDDVDIKPLLSTKDHGDTASDDGDKEELDSRDRYTDRGMPDHVPRKGAGRRCAWPSVPVEFIVTLYALSACGTGTITEQLLYTKISLRHNVSSVVFEDRDDSKCSSNHTSNLHFDDYQMIQAEASYWLVYIKLARCLPGVLVTLISGTVSDRISRKLPIILPIAASFVQNFILLMISVLNLPLPWFMVGSLVDGLSGSIYTLMMGCYAYLGDSVVREKRSFKIVLVECLRGLADVAAYIAAGYAVKYLGFTPPFISTTTLLFISLISALFFLPSTSKTENKTDNTFPNDSDTPTCSKYHIFDTCIFLRNVFRRKTRGLVLLCILILCCFINGEYSRGGPQILLQQNVPFCWNAKVIGLYMATQAFIHSLLMVFIVGVFQKRVGDVALVCVGSAGGAVSVFVQAFSVNTPMLFSVSVIGAFNIMGYTLIKVVLSKLVTVREQGKVFSLMAVLEISVDMAGTSALNSIYAATLHVFRGIVFVIIALVYVFGFLLSVVLYFKYKSNSKSIERELEMDSIKE